MTIPNLLLLCCEQGLAAAGYREAISVASAQTSDWHKKCIIPTQ
jgi:hypothetical protein